MSRTASNDRPIRVISVGKDLTWYQGNSPHQASGQPAQSQGWSGQFAPAEDPWVLPRVAEVGSIDRGTWVLTDDFVVGQKVAIYRAHFAGGSFTEASVERDAKL